MWFFSKQSMKSIQVIIRGADVEMNFGARQNVTLLKILI